MFEIIEPIIRKGKKQTGRERMTIWEVILLSVIRMTLNTNYDRLLWIANSYKYVCQLIRKFIGKRLSYVKRNLSYIEMLLDQIEDQRRKGELLGIFSRMKDPYPYKFPVSKRDQKIY